jgi:hypothetical protein
LDAAEYIKRGNKFDPIIVAASNENREKMIVLEGRPRLTAMNLAIEDSNLIK